MLLFIPTLRVGCEAVFSRNHRVNFLELVNKEVRAFLNLYWQRIITTVFTKVEANLALKDSSLARRNLTAQPTRSLNTTAFFQHTGTWHSSSFISPEPFFFIYCTEVIYVQHTPALPYAVRFVIAFERGAEENWI